MKAFLDWLDHRTGYKLLVQGALDEPIPGGARWRYITGSMLTFAFLVQVITGFALWAAYSPSTQTAWESVYYIQHVMSYGWLVRGIHHYAAQAMMVLLGLHFLQVIWDGAYRAPREVNFWLGLILMQIVIGLSLTGYLLPWDQKGYYATKVATNIAGATPIIGPQVQQIAQGGVAYGHHTLTRFFALHAGLLPALLVFFLVLHIYVFRRHGITAPDAEWRSQHDTTFWPDQVLKDGVACLAVLATVGSTAPFVGLLGTTMGIVNAFTGMAASGSGGLAAIGAGIAEALITTAFGLLVAIPAVWAYNYFSTKIDNLVAEMTYVSKEMIDYLIKGVSGEFGRSRFTREFNAQAGSSGPIST